MFLKTIFIFSIGLSLGSFANVVIHRMPRGLSLIRPGSCCVHCSHHVPWYLNIPLVGYLILRGRCRWCGEKISFRYFFNELAAGLLFLFMYVRYQFQPAQFFLFTFLFFVLLIISWIDIDHYIIPDIFSVGILAAGICFSWMNPLLPGHWAQALGWSLLGALSGSLLLLFIAVVSEKIMKKETMGGGDIKLIAGIGSFLGWQGALAAIFIASLCGSVYGLASILIKHKKNTDPIPFGPFLSAGSFCAFIFLEKISALFF